MIRYFPGIEEVFVDKKQAVFFYSIPEAVELVEYYLKNSLEREMIADAGRHEVHRNHTFDVRIQDIFTKFDKKEKSLV